MGGYGRQLRTSFVISQCYLIFTNGCWPLCIFGVISTASASLFWDWCGDVDKFTIAQVCPLPAMVIALLYCLRLSSIYQCLPWWGKANGDEFFLRNNSFALFTLQAIARRVQPSFSTTTMLVLQQWVVNCICSHCPCPLHYVSPTHCNTPTFSSSDALIFRCACVLSWGSFVEL